MPRDGSGNYTLPVGNPVVSDTVITSNWANDTMSDLAVQLNNVLTRDGILGPTQPFKLIDGAVGTPGLGFSSEPGLGLFRVNTSILGVAAAGKQLAIVDATTAASVTTSLYPRAAGASGLNIHADIYGTANTTALRLANDATQGYVNSSAFGTGVQKPIQYGASRHNFIGTLWAKDSSGIVAIDRIDNVANTGNLRFTTAESQRFVINYNSTGGEVGNAGNLTFYRVQNDGVTVENALNINRADGTVSLQRALWCGTAQAAGVTSFICTRDAQFGGAVGLTAGNLTLSDGTKGLFVVGASVPALSTTSFFLSGTTRVSRVWDATTGPAIQLKAEADHDPGVAAHIIHYVSTSAFTMNNSGQGSSTGGWVATSDRRVKEQIVPIENALEKLLKLSGNTYLKTDMVGLDGVVPRKAGYIAQEIQAVLPEAVTVGSDEMGTLSVDHNGVIGLLIEAVKELNARTQIH